ncbi:MAG: hypothetical protein KKF89_05130, partial [Nanoarchaeota archaeon]|nr:hypothetical protein [Nanoarchaeota archaeon]
LYSPFSMGLHFSKYLALSVMAKDKNEFSESIRKSMGSNEIFDEKFSKFLDDVANNCFNQVNFLPIEFLTSGNRRLNKGSICSGDVLVGMDASGKLFYSTIIRQALSLRDLASIDLEPHNVYEKRSFFS